MGAAGWVWRLAALKRGCCGTGRQPAVCVNMWPRTIALATQLAEADPWPQPSLAASPRIRTPVPARPRAALPRLPALVCSVGVHLNVAGHASDHAYKVVQSLGFPLYHPAWRVRLHAGCWGARQSVRRPGKRSGTLARLSPEL